MMFRKIKRNVPGLNTTSTADISFMLLIFFLVTTSMDIDKGLSRQLPAVTPKDKQQEQTDINEDLLLKIEIDAENNVFVDGKPEKTVNLRNRVEAFIEKSRKEHIISFQCDRNSDYESYFNVQNEIMAAYRRLRDKYAVKRFHHGYQQCSQSEKEAVRNYYPQRISELYNVDEEELK